MLTAVPLLLVLSACGEDVGALGDDGGRRDGGRDGGQTEPPPPPPPPQVTSLTPQEGPFGTEVTLTGAHLRDNGSERLFVGDALRGQPVELTSGHEAVVSWTDTEIRFRYPFPAEGAVTVKTTGGEAASPAFAPDWIPGPAGTAMVKGDTLLDALAPEDARVFALVQGKEQTRLVEFTSTGAREHTFSGDGRQLAAARLFAGSGGVGGMALTSGTTPKLMKVSLQNDAPMLTDTGVAALASKGILAAGRDGQGAFAWLRNPDGKVVRVRESGAAWVICTIPAFVTRQLWSCNTRKDYLQATALMIVGGI
ncbi:MAG: IPT/TIG domain-containing protein, partial [Myxococcales bacterium]